MIDQVRKIKRSAQGRHHCLTSELIKDPSRRRTLDLDNQLLPVRPLADCVRRSGCSDVEIPEIVKLLICEVESRGLQTRDIYHIQGQKVNRK